MINAINAMILFILFINSEQQCWIDDEMKESIVNSWRICSSHRISFQRHEKINFFYIPLYSLLLRISLASRLSDAHAPSAHPAAPAFVFAVDCGFGKPKWRRSHATGHQRDTRGFDGWIIYPIMSQRKGLPPYTAPRPRCIINVHYDDAKASLLAAILIWDWQSGSFTDYYLAISENG